MAPGGVDDVNAARSANDLEGPWTRGTVIYEFPEMADNDPEDPAIACYAVTEHPQFRQNDGDTLVITYACNSTKGLVPSVDNLDFYYPKTLTVDLGRN